MPGEVRKVEASSIQTSGGQTEGMVRKGAIVDMSDKICASGTACNLCMALEYQLSQHCVVMLAKPHTSSAIHHHGEQDTIVYAASGYGAVVSEGGQKRQELSPGDFALIPAFAEHQEVNDGDEDVFWIITRSGRNPIVENLDGWNTTQPFFMHAHPGPTIF